MEDDDLAPGLAQELKGIVNLQPELLKFGISRRLAVLGQ
jgi:hypothetical protein